MDGLTERVAAIEVNVNHHSDEIARIKDRLFSVLLSICSASILAAGTMAFYLLTLKA